MIPSGLSQRHILEAATKVLADNKQGEDQVTQILTAMGKQTVA